MTRKINVPPVAVLVTSALFWIVVLTLCIFSFATSALPAESDEDVGEVEFMLASPAFVDEILDGDTIRVRAEVWPGVVIHTLVRIAGIDAPETRRPKCGKEKNAGIVAKRELMNRVPLNDVVVLTGVKIGKFAGRVVAQVLTPEGVDVGREMLASGSVRPYNGRGKRPEWCLLLPDG